MLIKRNTLYVFVLGMVLSISGVLFLFFVGQYALNGMHAFQFYADSSTYQKAYEGTLDGFNSGLILSFSSNYLGPLIVLSMLSGNIYLVLIFNVITFSSSIIMIAKQVHVSSFRLAILSLLNPLTVSSLLSVNKEVFIFPFFAFYFKAIIDRSISYLIISLCISFLIRWQFAVFSLLGWLLFGRFFKRNKKTSLLVTLLLVSLAYFQSQGLFSAVIAASDLSISNYDSSGTGLFEFTLQLQKEGLYFFVMPIKALLLMFGMGLKPFLILDPRDIYNDVIVRSYSLVMMILFVLVFLKGKLTIYNDYIYLGVVYLILFGVTPIFSPRYFFPIYFLLVVTLLSQSNKSQFGLFWGIKNNKLTN